MNSNTAKKRNKKPKIPISERGALTTAEAAVYLNVSEIFLRQSRMNGNRIGHAPGPKFIRAGRMIRYPVRFLDEWMEHHTVEPKQAPEENTP